MRIRAAPDVVSFEDLTMDPEVLAVVVRPRVDVDEDQRVIISVPAPISILLDAPSLESFGQILPSSGAVDVCFGTDLPFAVKCSNESGAIDFFLVPQSPD